MATNPQHAITAKSNNGILRTIITPVLASLPRENPISGFNGIWDTGATNTLITQDVVDRLGLVPIGRTHVNTASEINKEVNQYLIDVFLKHDLKIESVLVTLGVLTPDLHFLIGMDIIGIGDFSITNYNGKTCMSFRVPSSHEIDYVKNINQGISLDSRLKNSAPPSLNSPCTCGSGKQYKRCCGK